MTSDSILRYDLTLPLLLNVRYEGRPLRLWAAGKAYRRGRIDAQHLEAFHQAEVFASRRAHPPRCLADDRARDLSRSNVVLPGRTVKIVPTAYAMCSQAWELEVEDEGRWSEVMAWGVYTDRIVAPPRRRPGDPHRHRRRLRARAVRDAALRDRRHPQGRRDEGGVGPGFSRAATTR